MVGLLSIMIVLGTVFAIMLGNRGHGLRPGLARTRVRTAGGPNAASLLAVIAIASLILETGNLPVFTGIPSVAALLAALAVVLIVGVVVGRGVTEVIIGFLAVMVLAITAGVSGTIALITLVALMLWLLTALRGWMG